MAKGHLARLTALAAASGMLLVVGAAPAGAATVTDRVFDATNSGAVLRVTINLPAGVDGVVPQRIVQDIVLTEAAARTGDSAAALGNAFLGQSGSVPALQELLAGKAQANLSKTTDKYSLLEVPANPLGLTGGALLAESAVANPNVDGVISSSSSSITSLELRASGALGAVLAPIEAALASALGVTAPTDGSGDLTTVVEPVTTTVTDLVDGALTTLDGVTNDTSAPVSDATRDAVELLTAELNTLLTDLNAQVLNISNSDTLLDVGLVESSQSVTREAGTVTSSVQNKLVGIDLLAGLINVSGIESAAMASLGANGASAADANATILKAQVGDLVSLELANDLKAKLGGTVGDALPAEVVTALNDTLAQITTLLTSTLGLQNPTQAQAFKSHSADEATARVEAASLVLDPLKNPDAPLLSIGFVPAEATVKAQSFTATPVQLTQQLPRTGGELPLAGAVATLLIGAALVARRRNATV